MGIIRTEEYKQVVVDEFCLVLNGSWHPIGFTRISNAICAMMRDMAFAVHPETYEPLGFSEWVDRAPFSARLIKTSSRPIPAPDVVVLRNYSARPPTTIGFNRQNLLKRDEHTCQYCGAELPAPKLQVEHVLPRSRGGQTTWTNTVAACKRCNNKKADRTPQEAGMTLRRKPFVPKWKPRMAIPHGDLRDSWVPFLDKIAV